ncbi:GNVR domain-containing protein [Paraburkholderia sp. BCC1885]|uniref:GNVR domain-containing protein n=1 Tax=Paraburkholderia sp. BCC1885 TaxID=2562669 RepID=UPI0021B455DD|nr:GNVR domain-containing protein [Paraburkholderia sp. BCC1885]
MGSLLDVLYQNRRMIVIVTACFVFFGVAYALLSAPVYQADILIQVEETPNTAKDALSDVKSMFAVKTAASAEIEVLRSRLVIAGAVKSAQLDISATPRYFPVIGRWLASQLKDLTHSGMGGYAWGREHISVSKFDVPDELDGAKFIVTQRENGNYSLKYKDIELSGRVGELLHAETSAGTIDLLVDQIVGKPGVGFELVRSSELSAIQNVQDGLLILEKGKDSDVIGVALEGTDPKKISAILNAIGAAYVQQNVLRTQEEAQKSISFLDGQLPELKSKLETAENEFNTFRAKNGTVDLTAEAAALLQRSAMAQGKVADLQQQRALLLARYTEENPAVIAVNDELNEAQREVGGIAAVTRQLPPMEQNLLRLQREVQVDTNLYTNLLNTREQLRLLKAGKVSNVRLVDTAIVPDRPIRPKRSLAVAGSLMTGLFVGVALVLIKRKLVDGVAAQDEIEAGTGLAVYATVPRSKTQEMLTRKLSGNTVLNLVLARASSGDAAIESLRSFRSALEFALLDATNRIVLLAGPTPIVGKSFVSVNLATLIGASGQRVLLVDADLRRGTLHQYLGVPCSPGLTNIVTRGRTFEDAVHRNILPGVDFLANGGYVQNASEILKHRNFLAFATQADSDYDVVLIDAPPVLPVADSGIVASVAGMVFLVARHGVTTVEELRESTRRFEQIGVSVRGVIFNDVASRPGRYGTGYDAYKYPDSGFADDAGRAS